jgi:hypothetical protein
MSFVPCPACGGQVHQIASKCKHCKADLLALREQAEQAARAQQAQLRQTNRAVAPPPPARGQQRAPTSPVADGGSQPNPIPQVVYAQPSGWSRRWPIAVSAVAVVAIIASLVVLLRDGDDDDGRLPDRAGGTSPHMIPDEMPEPTMPAPGSPHGSNTPPPPGIPDPGAVPRPKSWTTAPDPGMFPVALTETVCAKLADCGFRDDFSDLLCRELAKGMSNPDLDAKVKSGECSYNRGSASLCLRAIDSLSCSLTSPDDLTAFFDEATNLFDCSRAYTCN